MVYSSTNKGSLNAMRCPLGENKLTCMRLFTPAQQQLVMRAEVSWYSIGHKGHKGDKWVKEATEQTNLCLY